MNKLRLVFEKTGRAKYISHLDLMRTFQRAFQRAGVPIRHTEGFNPHAHISIALPLPVGTESVCEILDFESPAELDGGIVQVLNAALPEGISIRELSENMRKTGEIAWIKCELRLIYDGGVPEGAAERINSLFKSQSVIISKKSKKGRTDFDIIPCIKSLDASQNGTGEIVISAVAAAQNPSLNPMLISDAIAKYLPELAPNHASCLRLRLLDKEFEPF